MKQANNKKIVIIRFVALYAATLLILILLFSAFRNRQVAKPEVQLEVAPALTASDAITTLLSREESLRLSFYQLQLNDASYLKGKTSGKRDNLADLKAKSDQQLLQFESMMRSFDKPISGETPELLNELEKIRDFFKGMLDVRKENMSAAAGSTSPVAVNGEPASNDVIADNIISSDNTVSSSNPAGAGNAGSVSNAVAAKNAAADLKWLQVEIEKRNLLIADLRQRETTARSGSSSGMDQLNQQVKQLKKEIASKNRQLAEASRSNPAPRSTVSPANAGSVVTDLEKRNANLVAGFNTIQTQMGLLQKKYNIVKAENNRLASRIQAADR